MQAATSDEAQKGLADAHEGDVPTVMVVGKCGMGKSTLCNMLLYGEPDPGEAGNGFKVGSGSLAVTTECETKTVQSTPPPSTMAEVPAGGPLRVIDTPGLPDTSGRTLEFYDKIVETARSTGGLNALIIVVHFNQDRLQSIQDFKKYSSLLSQFDKIPCVKLLLCHIQPQPGCTPEQSKTSSKEVQDWATAIVNSAGMKFVTTVYLVNENPTISEQVFKVRQLAIEQPWVAIEEFNIKTYQELVEAARRLAAVGTRAAELMKQAQGLKFERMQLADLIKKLKAKARDAINNGCILAIVVVAGGVALECFYTGVPLGTLAGMGIFLTKLLGKGTNWASDFFSAQAGENEVKLSMLVKEAAGIMKEVANGTVDLQAFSRDKDTLEQLQRLEGL